MMCTTYHGIAHFEQIPPSEEIPSRPSVRPSVTSVAMSGLHSSEWRSVADRLALFMQRHAVSDDKIARKLGWSREQLRAYLSPKARRLKAPSDVRMYLQSSVYDARPLTAVSCRADCRYGGRQVVDALSSGVGASDAETCRDEATQAF